MFLIQILFFLTDLERFRPDSRKPRYVGMNNYYFKGAHLCMCMYLFSNLHVYSLNPPSLESTDPHMEGSGDPRLLPPLCEFIE